MRPTQESYERDPQKRPVKEQSPRTDRNLMSLSKETNITHQQTRNTTTTKVTPKKHLPNGTTIEQPAEISVLSHSKSVKETYQRDNVWKETYTKDQHKCTYVFGNWGMRENVFTHPNIQDELADLAVSILSGCCDSSHLPKRTCSKRDIQKKTNT